MEPRIQYTKTSDGVRIAYWAMGEGPALVIPPNLIASHLQMEWQVPWRREFYEHLTKRATVVRYDCRGIGMSDRDVQDFTPDAAVLDLEAVVSRLELERFALMYTWSGPAVSAYAAGHPERLSHLVYIAALGAWSERDLETPRRLELLRPLAELDWELYTETVGLILAGPDYQPLGPFGKLIRASHSPGSISAIETAFGERQLHIQYLQAVQVPTLIIHGLDDETGANVARQMASTMRRAHVVGVPGRTMGPYLNEAGCNAVLDFITVPAVSPDPKLPSRAAAQTGLTVILFADIVDSTALTERLGDAAFRAQARDLDGELRTVIREGGGTPIEGKLLGDGVLATFASASQAITAALACDRAGEDAGLPLHLGLHAGDVIREEGNVFGGAVNVAARISGMSAPGEVLVSQTVRDLARTSAGVSFEDRGEQALKGVGDPVRVWEVNLQRGEE